MKIEPKLLKGFRDFLPPEVYQRRYLKNIIESTFEKYGYEPLETPTLEYFDILMGKYGEDEKLVYNFKDHGDRHVAMKYDLTVPTARVVAQYREKIVMPWKRYQIQPVWRADNTQKGRFREFIQCDADVFGSEEVISEAEFMRIGLEVFEKLKLDDFQIRINNRKILNAISEYLDASDKFNDIVNILDKWEKRSLEKNIEDLSEKGLSQIQIDKLVELVEVSTDESTKTLDRLEVALKYTKDGLTGINELRKIIELVQNDKLVVDLRIARGLAYYTGPIWEFSLVSGGVGSVGGGGRYDNLIGSFTGQNIPATGGSFGFERIMEVLKERNIIDNKGNLGKILMTIIDQKYANVCFDTAKKIRDEGFTVDLYPAFKEVKKQLEYANKKGYKIVILIGENEVNSNTFTIKNMVERTQIELDFSQMLEYIGNSLN